MNVRCFANPGSHSLIHSCSFILLLALAVGSVSCRKPNEAQINRMLTAASDGDLATVKSLLSENRHLVFSTGTKHRWTPLQCAAFNGRKDVAALLLANKADVNSKDPSGMTPLHLTAFHGATEVAALLLANRADVNSKANFGNTPLDIAVEYGPIDLAKLLLANGAMVNDKGGGNRSPLQDAAFHGRKDMVELLLANGAEVDAKSVDGKTPLHIAAGIGDSAIVELLLAHKAEVNAVDKNGITPMGFAKDMFLSGDKDKDIAEAFWPTKAQIAARNGDKNQSYHDAIVAGYNATFKLLVAHGGHD